MHLLCYSEYSRRICVSVAALLCTGWGEVEGKCVFVLFDLLRASTPVPDNRSGVAASLQHAGRMADVWHYAQT